MAPPLWVVAVLGNPVFRTFIAGSGFFADSYDLFVTDGVTNVLKNLGPIIPVTYTYNTSAVATQTVKVYFNALCDNTPGNAGGLNCLPYLYDYTRGADPWYVNPSSDYSPQMQPRYQTQTGDLKDAVSNAALIGSVLGQLGFGFAGDVFGRKWSFVITAVLIILGCLGAATAGAGHSVPNCQPVFLGPFEGHGSASCNPTGSIDNVYFQLVAWRFILGLGVGGEYPLASTITSESTTRATRGRAVLTIFSMQGWGKLTAAILNYAVIAQLQVFGGPWLFDATWRFALAFGCALNILTIYFRWHLTESKIYTDTKAKDQGLDQASDVVQVSPLAGATAVLPSAIVVAVKPSINIRSSLAMLWEFKYVLIGTASTWFLMDVTFYGQSLMNTTVVNSAVVTTTGLNAITKLRESLLATIYIMLIALPGYWFAIALIEHMGRYWMQQMGFLMCTLWFAVLAGGYNGTTGLGYTAAASTGFVIVYGLTYFFSNFGPNSTTFLMAGEAFPTRIRSTAHGMSAASGKIGATVGSSVLLAVFNSYCTQTTAGASVSPPTCTVGSSVQSQIASGIVTVMSVCAGVSILGNIMTTLFVKETGHLELEQVDALSKVAPGGSDAPPKLPASELTGLMGAAHQPVGRAAADWAPLTSTPPAR